MTKKKNFKKWTSVLLISGLLFGLSADNWKLHASYQESTYYDRMLAGFEYDQNDFKELVSEKVIAPSGLSSTASFASGVKYNGYQPDGNRGSSMTMKEMNASSEPVITTSFWMNLNQSGTIGIIPFSIGSYTLYQIAGRFGFNTFNHDVYGVNMERNSGNWVHVIATFNKGDVEKNTLYLNGKKQMLTHSSLPLNSAPYPSNATWNDSSVVYMGGHPSYPFRENSMVDEFHVLRGGIDEVDAQNLYSLSRVPELNAFQENNKAQLEWAVSTFNPNPFYKTSFEAGEDIPIKPRDDYNTVSLDSDDAYNGSNSLQYNQTTDLRGNGYFYPATTSNRSYVYFNDRKFVPNGTPVSLSFKAKSSERAIVSPSGIGGAASATIDHHKIYGGQPKVFLEDAPIGSKVLKVSNTSEIPQRAGVWVADRYIPVAQDEGPFYSYAEIDKIDVENNLIYLKKGLAEDFKAGQILQGHRSVNPISFPSQVVEGDGEWKNININTTVANYDYFDTMIRGFRLYLFAETAGTLQIDDIELVEATRAELYRGDTLIYSGYNSQFMDSQATDKAVPNKPELSKTEIANNVAKVTLLKPEDQGTVYDYKIRGVTSDGTKTVYSDTQEVKITSGIKGYSYVVDSSPSTIPNTASNTSSETISVPYASDVGTKYLHVRTIDNQGNAGETTHVKLTLPSTTAIPSSNGMYADLSWSFDINTEPFDYKVYTRAKGISSYTTKTTSSQTLKETIAIDVTQPAIISKPVFKRTSNGSYMAEFQPVQDLGTVYEYYVEAIGKNTGSIYKSPVKEVTVQSDMKGYAIEVSKSKTPTPSTVTATTSPMSFTVPDSTLLGDEPFYVHMKAIDSLGNQSVYTTFYESSTAYLVITPSTTDWTNKPITLTITGSQGIGAIKMLRLPNGSVVNSSSATFVVSENGNYPFYGQDEFGQWMSGGYTVTNIENVKPDISIPNLSPDWVNKDITIQIEAK